MWDEANERFRRLRDEGLGRVMGQDHQQLGTFFQPGKGPTSSFHPVEDCASGTALRLVQERSMARNSS
jgi:hypothetical protein